jgi:hypothetical protein
MPRAGSREQPARVELGVEFADYFKLGGTFSVMSYFLSV